MITKYRVRAVRSTIRRVLFNIIQFSDLNQSDDYTNDDAFYSLSLTFLLGILLFTTWLFVFYNPPTPPLMVDILGLGIFSCMPLGYSVRVLIKYLYRFVKWMGKLPHRVWDSLPEGGKEKEKAYFLRLADGEVAEVIHDGETRKEKRNTPTQ